MPKNSFWSRNNWITVSWGPHSRLAGLAILALLRSFDGINAGIAASNMTLATIASLHSTSAIALIGVILNALILISCAIDALKSAALVLRRLCATSEKQKPRSPLHRRRQNKSGRTRKKRPMSSKRRKKKGTRLIATRF